MRQVVFKFCSKLSNTRRIAPHHHDADQSKRIERGQKHSKTAGLLVHFWAVRPTSHLYGADLIDVEVNNKF